MKYVLTGGPENVNWFDVADLIAGGQWTVADACEQTGRSPAQLKTELARLAAGMAGSHFVRKLAVDSMNKIVEYEEARAASPATKREVLLEPEPPATSAVGASGGLAASKLVAAGLSVMVAGSGLYYWRKYSAATPPRVTQSAVPALTATPATLGASVPLAGLTCTRGEVIVTQLGKSLRSEGNAVTYSNPDNRISDSLGWESPPLSARVGDAVELVSWATHNGGRPMEMQWESGTGSAFDWGYGASSKDQYRSEGRKTTRLSFRGGSVRLKGGVNYGSADETFRMQWDYYCK